MFLSHREQDFCNSCFKPSKIKFCIEEVSVGEIYNTLLDPNDSTKREEVFSHVDHRAQTVAAVLVTKVLPQV